MAVLKHIGPGSAFKVGLVVYGFIGLIIGVLLSLIALVGAPFARQASIPLGGAFVGLFAVILCPILYGIFGGIVAAISALIYNLASGWVDGLEVELN